jgi:hypothetical protein
MKKMGHWIVGLPLDGKILGINFLMLFTLLLFPDTVEPNLFLMYAFFIFSSSAISAFYLRFVDESKYNVYRNIESIKKFVFVIVGHSLVCFLVAFVLTVTDLFLFLLP